MQLIKLKAISNNLILKSRSSFNEILLEEDMKNITNTLKGLGYYFSKLDILLTNLDDNKITLTYKVDLGEKSKIKKITFLGNKIFKDSKLKNIIISEEFKFWKFLSGKKYLNQNTIDFDETLLRNFYLSKGYYNVSINTSFAKLINENEFELIFNINAEDKFYFNEINLELPDDFDEENFINLKKIFSDVKGKPYSVNSVEKFLDEIDKITTNEEYLSIEARVDEEIIDNKINLKFIIKETENLSLKESMYLEIILLKRMW